MSVCCMTASATGLSPWSRRETGGTKDGGGGPGHGDERCRMSADKTGESVTRRRGKKNSQMLTSSLFPLRRGEMRLMAPSP